MSASLSPVPCDRNAAAERHVERWIREARQGSPDALGQLLEAGRKYLLMVAGQTLDDRLKAKIGASDLVQETFVAAQEGFEKFRGTTELELRGWMLAILANRMANYVRHFRSTQRRDVDRELPAEVGDEVLQGLADQAPTPGTFAVARDGQRRVRLALEKLPEPWRDILIARTWRGESFAVIGQRYDCTAEAARKKWARAVQELQRLLSEIE